MRELVVESRPDPDGSCLPVRFRMPGELLEEVEAVLDRWPGEDHRYFRVRVRGGSEYILRHDLAAGGCTSFDARADRTPRRLRRRSDGGPMR